MAGEVKIADMQWVGRGQDVNPDDALADARRRLAIEEIAFLSAGK
jgi:hypothetical protein